jgi:hypothetical protein
VPVLDPANAIYQIASFGQKLGHMVIVTEVREVRVWFRGKMDVPANRTIAKVTLAMAAEGCFTCLLNGRRVARCGECLDIQVADVTSDLKPGGNLVAVEAVLPAHVSWDRNRGGIVGAVRIEYTEGAPQTLLTDMNWKVATQEEDGWVRNDFNDATWPGAQTWSWKGTGISPWNLFDLVFQVGESVSVHPPDRKTNIVNVTLDAAIVDRAVRGKFTGSFGGDGADLVGKIRRSVDEQ